MTREEYEAAGGGQPPEWLRVTGRPRKEHTSVHGMNRGQLRAYSPETIQEVKRLVREGHLIREIADLTGVSRSRVGDIRREVRESEGAGPERGKRARKKN